jgi:hypothetical protein
MIEPAKSSAVAMRWVIRSAAVEPVWLEGIGLEPIASDIRRLPG